MGKNSDSEVILSCLNVKITILITVNSLFFPSRKFHVDEAISKLSTMKILNKLKTDSLASFFFRCSFVLLLFRFSRSCFSFTKRLRRTTSTSTTESGKKRDRSLVKRQRRRDSAVQIFISLIQFFFMLLLSTELPTEISM